MIDASLRHRIPQEEFDYQTLLDALPGYSRPRAKFFHRGAFYGGTALRILYGLDRFSEDLDFSLLAPDPAFRIDRYASQLEEEIAAFGFKVRAERIGKSAATAVESAFLKADTIRERLVIEAGRSGTGMTWCGTPRITRS